MLHVVLGSKYLHISIEILTFPVILATYILLF